MASSFFREGVAGIRSVVDWIRALGPGAVDESGNVCKQGGVADFGVCPFAVQVLNDVKRQEDQWCRAKRYQK
ncbi:hypothetical protein D3C81_1456780 [compost metagenome]